MVGGMRTRRMRHTMTSSQLPSMSAEEHISQLTAQIVALQAQLAHCSWSPPPPQPRAAPPPTPKPPKVATPTPISCAQDDLEHFKAECSLFLDMGFSGVMGELSSLFFVLFY